VSESLHVLSELGFGRLCGLTERNVLDREWQGKQMGAYNVCIW